MLVGPSGCGKTTAMRMVNRMIDITEGDILVGGRSVRDSDEVDLRREIGYVIQQIGLFPHRSIGDNIATVPRLLGWDKRRTTARVEELLDLIGLPQEMARRYPAQLSGGQRQRVGVARALAADPPLMLMDEPFGAIDPISRDRLQNEFLRLQASLRKTVVFVTHDIDEAIKMGDRIAVLEQGGILAQYGPPAELLMAPAKPFVEDFVGADRALKRLALQRVRNVNLWTAPLVRAGEPVAEAHAKVQASEVPYPLLVDADGRPVGWLSERALAGDVVPQEPTSATGPDRRARRRAARRAQHPARPRGPVRAGGRRAGPSRRRALDRAAGARDRADATRRRADLGGAGVTGVVLAQLQVRDRSGDDCVSGNGICPELDRRTTSTATCRRCGSTSTSRSSR